MTSFTVLLGALDGDSLLLLLGRFHPAVVHFPIALLTVAAVLEMWQIVRRKPELSPATPACLVLGALSAIAASVFGWFFDSGDGRELVELHRWVGIGATAVAVLAAILVFKAATSPSMATALRLFLLIGAALVGGTGYLGGELVFGQNHLFKGIFDDAKPSLPQVVSIAQGADHAPETKVPVAGKLDFAKEVAPLLTDYCLQCHGGKEVKGKFNLATKAGAMKGGREGPCIIPGQPDKSAFCSLLTDPDPETRMPPKKAKQLSKDQIDIIRKWIEQGADWPDGVALK